MALQLLDAQRDVFQRDDVADGARNIKASKRNQPRQGLDVDVLVAEVTEYLLVGQPEHGGGSDGG